MLSFTWYFIWNNSTRRVSVLVFELLTFQSGKKCLTKLLTLTFPYSWKASISYPGTFIWSNIPRVPTISELEVNLWSKSLVRMWSFEFVDVSLRKCDITSKICKAGYRHLLVVCPRGCAFQSTILFECFFATLICDWIKLKFVSPLWKVGERKILC